MPQNCFLFLLYLLLTASGQDLTSKAVAIFLPIMGFVALNLDHCVANMFLIPFGMMSGADVSVGDFIINMVAVTLGNMIGGAVCVAGAYFYVSPERLAACAQAQALKHQANGECDKSGHDAQSNSPSAPELANQNQRQLVHVANGCASA